LKDKIIETVGEWKDKAMDKTADIIGEKGKEKVNDFKEKVGDVKENVKDKVSDISKTVKDGASKAGEYVKGKAKEVYDKGE